MKIFFGSIFIEKQKLIDAKIKYPIKIEYYKTVAGKENVENKYGIEIVKTEYKKGNTNIETNNVPNITNSTEEADKILTLLKNKST